MRGAHKRTGRATRAYRTAEQVQAVADSLTPDDRRIVELVAQFRLVSARQLHRLLFAPDVDADAGELAAAQRRGRHRLARLVKLDVLQRLGRRIGGFAAGSAGYTYRLGPLGHRLVNAPGSRNRAWEPGASFIRHTLAITESYVILEELARTGELSLLRFASEPDCWRRFAGVGGTETVKPDADVIFRSHGYEAYWLLEIDRGTESRPALRHKLERYLRYFETGTEQEQYGLFPLIRFLVDVSGTPSIQTNEQRQAVIASVIAQLPTPARRLFAISALAELTTTIRAGPNST